MKTALLTLLLTAAVLTGGGCAFMSPEDRDFYGKGWVKPSDLDTPTPHHAITDPSRPQQASSAPARTSPSDADTPWLTPEQAPQ